MRSMNSKELRWLASHCGAVLLLLFAAIFISHGGLERATGTVASVNPTTQTASWLSCWLSDNCGGAVYGNCASYLSGTTATNGGNTTLTWGPTTSGVGYLTASFLYVYNLNYDPTKPAPTSWSGDTSNSEWIYLNQIVSDGGSQVYGPLYKDTPFMISCINYYDGSQGYGNTYGNVITCAPGQSVVNNACVSAPPPAPAPNPPASVVGSCSNIVVGGTTMQAITLTWSAPTSGSAPTGYYPRLETAGYTSQAACDAINPGWTWAAPDTCYHDNYPADPNGGFTNVFGAPGATYNAWVHSANGLTWVSNGSPTPGINGTATYATPFTCPSAPVTPPTDLCPSLTGTQTTYPSGSNPANSCTCSSSSTYNAGSNSCVVNAPTDLCPSLTGTQTTYPSGSNPANSCTCSSSSTYNAGSNSCVVTPPTDLCPSLTGTQTTYPSGSNPANSCTCASGSSYSSGTNSCVVNSPTCSDTTAINYGASGSCTYVGCSFGTSPSTVTIGSGAQSSTITWSSTNATNCSVSSGQGFSGGSGKSGSGSTSAYTSPSSGNGYPYTLTCTGPNNTFGPTSCNATRNVTVQCPSGTSWNGMACIVPVVADVSISASPTGIVENGVTTASYTITNPTSSAIPSVRYSITNTNGATCGVAGDYVLAGTISSCSTSGTIASLPPGNSTVTLTSGSRAFSGSRSVALSILPPSSGTAYQPAASPNNSATVVLTPVTPTVSAAPLTANEGGDTAVFTINNPGATMSNVAYMISNGNGASCGTSGDYTLSGKISSCATSGTIASLPPGDSKITLTTGATNFAGTRPVSFTLTASGQSATITLSTDNGTIVKALTATPSRVRTGGSTNLIWSTTGFTSCSLVSSRSGTISSALSSSGFPQIISGQTTFTLTCTQGANVSVQRVTVSILPSFIEL